MPDLLPITLPEMIKEAERELALRRRVYFRRVALKQMKQHQADRYIELQHAIINALHRLAEHEGHG